MSSEFKVEGEKEGIETVGELRQALSELKLVDDVPLSDGFGDPILVSLLRNMKSGELSVEIK
ncbi:MAG: hypothetical protein V1791_12685 [Pseudomonadota bacterium]